MRIEVNMAGSRHSRCKGPGAGLGLACLRGREEALWLEQGRKEEELRTDCREWVGSGLTGILPSVRAMGRTEQR